MPFCKAIIYVQIGVRMEEEETKGPNVEHHQVCEEDPTSNGIRAQISTRLYGPLVQGIDDATNLLLSIAPTPPSIELQGRAKSPQVFRYSD